VPSRERCRRRPQGLEQDSRVARTAGIELCVVAWLAVPDDRTGFEECREQPISSTDPTTDFVDLPDSGATGIASWMSSRGSSRRSRRSRHLPAKRINETGARFIPVTYYTTPGNADRFEMWPGLSE